MVTNGVFCLEGEWEPDLRKQASVLPVLELLERLGVLKSIHRHVATLGELEHYVSRWSQARYNDYRVLYLACHGDKGTLYISKGNEITLDQLADQLGDVAVGCYLYFGSCLTLFDERQARMFARSTGAAGVLGYRKEVDWIEGAAFEVILLSYLAEHADGRRRPESLFKDLMKRHGELARLYKFTMATQNDWLRSQDWPPGSGRVEQ